MREGTIILPQKVRLRKDSQLLKMILGNEHMNDTQVVSRLKKYNIDFKDNIDLDELYEAMSKFEGEEAGLLVEYNGKSDASKEI